MAKSRRFLTLLLAIAAVFAFAVLSLLIKQIVLAQSVPTSDVFNARISRVIGYLDSLLSDHSLSTDARKSIEFRKEFFEYQATQIAAPTEIPETIIAQKQTMAVEATSWYLLTTPLPTTSRPVGIQKDPEYIRFIEDEAHISDTFWVGKVGDSYFTVYSGYLRKDPLQGVVYAYPEYSGKWIRILTPERLGPLDIVDYKNHRLILTTSKDNTLYFDAPALRFASSIDEILPTATTDSSTQRAPYPSP